MEELQFKSEDNNMDIFKSSESIKTQEDFVAFIYALATDLQNNKSSWENPNLDKFLCALAAWVADMDGYYKNMNIPAPQNINWSAMANMFLAARTYE